MEAKIIINFKRINGVKVDDKLLKLTPNLPDVTKQTLQILCFQIKKYFLDHKIKVGVSYKLENE